MDITQMKLPRLRMCCFFVPLESGFLIWGYVNLVYHTLLMALSMFIALFALFTMAMGGLPSVDIILLLPLLLLFIVIYSILIVIAGHMKNMKLLRTTLIMGAILLIFEVLYSPCLSSRILIAINIKDDSPFGLSVVPVILEPFLQGYVLLLIRSKMLKLQEEDPSVEYVNLNKNEEETARDTVIIRNV